MSPEQEAPQAQPASEKPSESAVEKNLVEGWKERARRLGASPHAVAGALHDVPADRLLTEDQVRKRLKAFSDLKHDYSAEASGE